MVGFGPLKQKKKKQTKKTGAFPSFRERPF